MTKTFARTAVILLIAIALLFPISSTATADDAAGEYPEEKYSSSPNHTRWNLDSQPLHMERADDPNEEQDGYVTIAPGESYIWKAKKSEVAVGFPQKTWHGWITHPPVLQWSVCRIEIGVLVNGSFNSSSTRLEVIGGLLPDRWEMIVPAFTVPKDEFLAFKIEALSDFDDWPNNNATALPAPTDGYPVSKTDNLVKNSANYDGTTKISTTGHTFITLEDCTHYPTPILPGAVLLGTGLLLLVGAMVVRRGGLLRHPGHRNT